MDIGVRFPVVAIYGSDDLLGFLRTGCTIEKCQLLPALVPGREYWEILPYSGPISGITGCGRDHNPTSFKRAPREGHESNTNLARDRRFEKALNLFHRHSVNDRPEEPLDNQVLRFGARKPACLQIEQVLLLDLGDSRAMRAADVVGGDLQIRNRVCARRAAKDEIAILLIGVGLLRAFFDLDQPRIDRTSIALQRALELEVARAKWRLVELPGMVIEELIAVPKIDAQHLGQGVLSA